MLETFHNAAATFGTLATNIQTAMAMLVASATIAGIAGGLAISAVWRWART